MVNNCCCSLPVRLTKPRPRRAYAGFVATESARLPTNAVSNWLAETASGCGNAIMGSKLNCSWPVLAAVSCVKPRDASVDDSL